MPKDMRNEIGREEERERERDDASDDEHMFCFSHNIKVSSFS